MELINHYSKNCKTIYHLAAVLGVDIVSNKNVETMNCEFEELRMYAMPQKNKIKKLFTPHQVVSMEN